MEFRKIDPCCSSSDASVVDDTGDSAVADVDVGVVVTVTVVRTVVTVEDPAVVTAAGGSVFFIKKAVISL
jgi:hypothetical protein